MITLIIVSFGSASIAAETSSQFDARVMYITDGDTLKVQQPGGKPEICRLTGYNAPAMRGKERSEGIIAKRKLAELVFEKAVHVKTYGHDRWERLLCEIILPDGTNINKAMRAWLESNHYKHVGKYDHLGHVAK